MSIQQFFPFTPDYMSWDDWNGNMVIFFEEEAIPVNDEENWKKTVAGMTALPTFQAYPIPDPELFEDWRAWADEFTTVLNGPSQ